jgi:hypothetical protein
MLHRRNIWFSDSRRLTIKVLIDVQVSHYFKRRRMFPTQEIIEERPDGSLVVTFQVGHYEAIRNILKSWIPNILILEPEEFRKDLLEDVAGWVKRQESVVWPLFRGRQASRPAFKIQRGVIKMADPPRSMNGLSSGLPTMIARQPCGHEDLRALGFRPVH